MTEATLAAPPTPFKGLAPFGESELDTLLFFGREREIEVIAANLVASRLTVLYGPSGVGKTSLLRAGVVTRLRNDEGAGVLVLSTWSRDPIDGLLRAMEEEARRVRPGVGIDFRGRSLADALGDWSDAIGGELYVILDQFEEYFLYHESGGPFDELAEIIRGREHRANFLISIREDALAQLDAFKTQLPNLFGNSLRLDLLDRPAATRAIVGPLERYNELAGDAEPVVAEAELVEEVLDSVRAGQIQLGATGRGGAEDAADSGRIEAPYLQLVLERLWNVERERGSARLRLATLRELGGAARIVEEHLERAMSILSAEEQDAAAAMYNHLVTPSGTKIAHRAGDLARYASVDEAEAGRVLDRLVRERIVRAAEDGAAGPQYEIFHDVLADAVLAWRTRHEAEQRLEAERREASHRQRRTIGLAAGLGFLIAVLAAAGVYAFAQRASADDSARDARAHDLAALAEATLPTSPERSLGFALQAADTASTPTVENALRRTLRTLRTSALLRAGAPVVDIAYSPDGSLLAVATGDPGVRLYSTRAPHGSRPLNHPQADVLSFSSDGRRIVTAGMVGGARIWNTASGEELLRLPHSEPVTEAVFSERGSLVATAGLDGRARVWDARNGRLLRAFRHPHAVTGVDFNRDGTLLVTAARDRAARVFDARTGRKLAELRHRRKVVVARFTPHADIVATGGADRVGRLWDARTGRLRETLEGHTRGLLWVAFSGDGSLVATSSADATGRVWNTDDGTRVSILTGHINFVSRVEFGPKGRLIVTGSRDRTARVFEASSATLRATLAGHDEPVTDVAFAPDGRTVATASADGTVRIWDAIPLPLMPRVHNLGQRVGDVAFTARREIVSVRRGQVLSPDGRRAAAITEDGRLTVSDVLSGRVLATIDDGAATTAVAFSADGDRVATGDRDGSLRLWRVEDGHLELTIPSTTEGPVTAVAVSPDGRRILAGSTEAGIWNVESGRREMATGRGHRGPLTSATFSPDGLFAVTTSRDHDARLWDVETGRQVWMVPHTAIVSDAAFSADGRWVALAGPGYAGIVDAKTGERILLLDGQDVILTSIAFSPSGWRIATGGKSGAVRTYDCELCGGIDELIPLGRKRLAQLRPAS